MHKGLATETVSVLPSFLLIYIFLNLDLANLSTSRTSLASGLPLLIAPKVQTLKKVMQMNDKYCEKGYPKCLTIWHCVILLYDMVLRYFGGPLNIHLWMDLDIMIISIKASIDTDVHATKVSFSAERVSIIVF